MKNAERALIATGVALVFSGGIASAAILSNATTAQAAAVTPDVQLAAQLAGGATGLADTLNNGGRGGADLLTAAATYIGLPAADIKTQLASGKSLADIAVGNGKTREGLIAALVAAQQQSIATYVDTKGTANPKPGGPGNGAPGGPGFGLKGFGAEGDSLASAATFLGTTTADLRTKLQSGQTLAQIATAAGKTRDALIAALVTDATTAIEKAKTDGKLTADQATTLETGLTARITQEVDSTEPAGRGPRR
jgi:hypothetical protein